MGGLEISDVPSTHRRSIEHPIELVSDVERAFSNRVKLLYIFHLRRYPFIHLFHPSQS